MGFRITWMWIAGRGARPGGGVRLARARWTSSRAVCGSRKTRSTSFRPSSRPSQSQLQAARRESADLRTQLADGTRTARVEQVSALGQVEAIELNRFLTGGLDRDGVPGDETVLRRDRADRLRRATSSRRPARSP